MSRGTRLINGEIKAWSTGAVARVLDVLLPPRCAGCGAAVAVGGPLCTSCWSKARFLGGPGCAVCGYPFAYDPGPHMLCGGCYAKRPVFARLRAAAAYDDATRPLVLAFKHGDRTELAPRLAHWMLRAGSDLVADADMIVPVPLHWTRLFARRFNQAALLAQNLSALSGVAVHADLLVRRRRTPSQGGLSAKQREKNVAGAFAVRPRVADKVVGRRILLIDDVMTTGATATSATRALLRAGAGAVDVLTLTRVVRAS